MLVAANVAFFLGTSWSEIEPCLRSILSPAYANVPAPCLVHGAGDRRGLPEFGTLCKLGDGCTLVDRMYELAIGVSGGGVCVLRGMDAIEGAMGDTGSCRLPTNLRGIVLVRSSIPNPLNSSSMVSNRTVAPLPVGELYCGAGSWKSSALAEPILWYPCL